MQTGSSIERGVNRFIEYAVFVLVNVGLAIGYFSAAQQVIRESISEDGLRVSEASDSITWLATAVPYLISALALEFVFALWASYSAWRWKVYLRLILVGGVAVLWLGALATSREINQQPLG